MTVCFYGKSWAFHSCHAVTTHNLSLQIATNNHLPCVVWWLVLLRSQGTDSWPRNCHPSPWRRVLLWMSPEKTSQQTRGFIAIIWISYLMVMFRTHPEMHIWQTPMKSCCFICVDGSCRYNLWRTKTSSTGFATNVPFSGGFAQHHHLGGLKWSQSSWFWWWLRGTFIANPAWHLSYIFLGGEQQFHVMDYNKPQILDDHKREFIP